MDVDKPYAPLTADNFYHKLIKNYIFLSKPDVEGILTKTDPFEKSWIVRFENAAEEARKLYETRKDDFYRKLIANNVFLRKPDIESILANKDIDDSEKCNLVNSDRIFEEAVRLNEHYKDLRKPRDRSYDWNGKNRRVLQLQ